MRLSHVADIGGIVRGYPVPRDAGIRHRARTSLLTASVNTALKGGRLVLDREVEPNPDPFGVRTPAGLFTANMTWTPETGAVRIAAQTMSRRGDVFFGIAWLRRGARGVYFGQDPLSIVKSWLQIENGDDFEMPLALARILAAWKAVPAGEFLPNGNVLDVG